MVIFERSCMGMRDSMGVKDPRYYPKRFCTGVREPWCYPKSSVCVLETRGVNPKSFVA